MTVQVPKMWDLGKARGLCLRNGVHLVSRFAERPDAIHTCRMVVGLDDAPFVGDLRRQGVLFHGHGFIVRV